MQKSEGRRSQKDNLDMTLHKVGHVIALPAKKKKVNGPETKRECKALTKAYLASMPGRTSKVVSKYNRSFTSSVSGSSSLSPSLLHEDSDSSAAVLVLARGRDRGGRERASSKDRSADGESSTTKKHLEESAREKSVEGGRERMLETVGVEVKRRPATACIPSCREVEGREGASAKDRSPDGESSTTTSELEL